MKKFLIFLATLLLLVGTVFPAAASYNSEIELKADIALLISLNNEKGTVIFDKNADRKAAPASLTKIATAAVSLKNCSDLENTMVTVKQESIDSLVGTDSSLANIQPGEQLSMLELLYCMMVASGNDAAVVIADYIGGGNVSTFVEMMNSLAAELGCTSTHFSNPHGLDADDHYTTANDLAKITQYALSFPVFEKICSTTEYTLRATNVVSEERTLLTTNLILNDQTGYYYEYASGIKTGHTDNAGRCVISKASKDGYEYLGIIMHAPFEDYTGDTLRDNGAFLECVDMFEWAFENIRYKAVCDTVQPVTTINVEHSWSTDHVRLVSKESKKLLVPDWMDSSNITLEPVEGTVPESMEAPIEKGQVIGKAKIVYTPDGENAEKIELGEVELVAAEEVKGSVILFIFGKIADFTHTTTFKVLVVMVLLIVAFFIIATVISNHRKKRDRIRVVKDYRRIK